MRDHNNANWELASESEEDWELASESEEEWAMEALCGEGGRLYWMV